MISSINFKVDTHLYNTEVTKTNKKKIIKIRKLKEKKKLKREQHFFYTAIKTSPNVVSFIHRKINLRFMYLKRRRRSVQL